MNQPTAVESNVNNDTHRTRCLSWSGTNGPTGDSVTVRYRFPFPKPLMLIFCIISGCGGAGGLERFPVEGTVTVNGAPAERVVVLLHHADESTPGSYRFPTAVTTADGSFRISSIGEADGAIKGTYKVTFTWLSSAELDAIDMFNGGFGDPSSTTYELTVPVADGRETKFDLVVPESQLRRPGQR